MTCSWEDVDLKKVSPIEAVMGDASPVAEQKTPPEEMFPGAFNSGWEHYFEWASKDFGAWQGAFQKAECERLKESRRWLEY